MKFSIAVYPKELQKREIPLITENLNSEKALKYMPHRKE